MVELSFLEKTRHLTPHRAQGHLAGVFCPHPVLDGADGDQELVMAPLLLQ